MLLAQDDEGHEACISSSDFGKMQAAIIMVSSYKTVKGPALYAVGKGSSQSVSTADYELVALYHHHVGSASSGGGCYTVPVMVHECRDCYERATGYWHEVSHGGWSNSEGKDYGDLGTSMEWVETGRETVHVGGLNKCTGYSLGCGKTTSTLEYTKVLLKPSVIDTELDSSGTVNYDNEVALYASDVHAIAEGIKTAWSKCHKYVVDQFLAGRRSRVNTHGISKTNYIRHAHSDACYTDGTLTCLETEGQTVDGIELYYNGSYIYHVHIGVAEAHSGKFKDDTVLYQEGNPGGCFAAAGHEHSDRCYHSHNKDCVTECQMSYMDELLGASVEECPECGQVSMETNHYNISHDTCADSDLEWTLAVRCDNCGHTDAPNGVAKAVKEKLERNAGLHVSYTCSLEDGGAVCGDYTNVWKIGCGKSVNDVVATQ